jgi:hypothetical protein
MNLQHLMKCCFLLRIRNQAFWFHSIRDELQLFVADKRIVVDSEIYRLLMRGSNLVIRNARTFTIRDFLLIARTIEKQVDAIETQKLRDELAHCSPEVKNLTKRFFEIFSEVLIQNDRLISEVVSVRYFLINLSAGCGLVRNLFSAFFDMLEKHMRDRKTSRGEAIQSARYFRNLSSVLVPA